MHKKYLVPSLVIAVVTLGFMVRPPETVGSIMDGGTIVPTGQRIKPAGDVLETNGRPVDVALSPDHTRLYTKGNNGVVVIHAASWKVEETVPFPSDGGGSMHGIIVNPDGSHVYASTSSDVVWEGTIDSKDTAHKLTWTRKIILPGPGGKGASYPCGLALSPNTKTLYVCLSRNNTVGVVDIASGTVTKEIPVGIAPYAIAFTSDGKTAVVTNWGGSHPTREEPSANSAGTPTKIDAHGVGASGCVSLLDLSENKEIAQVATGLHPSDIALTHSGTTAYIANANSDTISVLDIPTRQIRETISTRPESALTYGSAPNALVLSRNEKTLFIANGGNNAVAVLRLGASGGKNTSRILGFVPTGWYPGALAADDTHLYIASVKGIGGRGAKPDAKGQSVYNFQAVYNRLPLPLSEKELTRLTRQALTDAHTLQSLSDQDVPRKGSPLPAPVPVPVHVGEPSVFQHIVYVIKENRTYDGVFGDLKQGNGDPNLCLFGREVTPNHHAIAEEFVLLDNFYCNGVNSADGHSWATEGNCTDHLEKSFGGFTRSYTFGDDPLTYSSTGFLWDNVLDHGKTFRNFGEMDYSNEKPDVSYSDVYKDWMEKTGKIHFEHNIGIARLKEHSSPNYPGWNMDVPDVLRASVFLNELKGFEAKNDLPALSIVYLPDDHTTGTTPGDPTTKSYLADNDLALGQVVEGISKSRFWSSTCIFVVEDDSQDGLDHVDGHRSPCLVISPYTRRGAVVHQFYNQAGVIHTMERILGLPAMNQMDAMAPLMTDCFESKPDLRPYDVRANTYPINELNKKVAQLHGAQRQWARISKRLPMHAPDAANDDLLNRIIWHSVKGKATYPARVADRD